MQRADIRLVVDLERDDPPQGWVSSHGGGDAASRTLFVGWLEMLEAIRLAVRQAPAKHSEISRP